MLLVFTNTSASQTLFIHPSSKTDRPTLPRIIVERDLPHRTAVQQDSSIYWNFREPDTIRAALEEAFDVEPSPWSFAGSSGGYSPWSRAVRPASA